MSPVAPGSCPAVPTVRIRLPPARSLVISGIAADHSSCRPRALLRHHRRIKRDDQSRAVGASRNRKFESISLQERVCKLSVPRAPIAGARKIEGINELSRTLSRTLRLTQILPDTARASSRAATFTPSPKMSWFLSDDVAEVDAPMADSQHLSGRCRMGVSANRGNATPCFRENNLRGCQRCRNRGRPSPCGAGLASIG